MAVTHAFQGDNPFAEAAAKYADAGIAVIPCRGDDGKRPLIRNWGRWRHPPSLDAIVKWAADFPGANIGAATEPSRLTVVDIDDPKRIEEMLERCGDTPLKTRTPSGGVHLFYRRNGERSQNRIVPGVDVKAAGGFIVLPPSRRFDTGAPYELIVGGLDNLDRLPETRPGSLPLGGDLGAGNGSRIPEGMRDRTIFGMALRDLAEGVDPDLVPARALARNESCDPPLPEKQVLKAANSAIQYHVEGNNWVGREARVVWTRSQFEELKHDPDALALETQLRLAHGVRDEDFAICPEAMARDQVIPGWGVRRYRSKRDRLLELGRIIQTHKGGRGQHDPHLFRFALNKGASTAPNITRHPLPLGNTLTSLASATRAPRREVS